MRISGKLYIVHKEDMTKNFVILWSIFLIGEPDSFGRFFILLFVTVTDCKSLSSVPLLKSERFGTCFRKIFRIGKQRFEISAKNTPEIRQITFLSASSKLQFGSGRSDLSSWKYQLLCNAITEVKQCWAWLILGWETVQVFSECCS